MYNKIYNFYKIEKKIQNYWLKNKIYKTSKINNLESKFYCLVMLPYPSGKLHLGHVRNYTIGDVIARFKRLLGKNVLHPIGWDAFGLPAEQAAINKNCSPKKWTINNIKYMKKQLIRLGLSYDWDKEISTCDDIYYRWEQWLFLKLYNKNIIYRKKSYVNWCSYHNTVLANEQVINNKCWRCNYPIIMKNIYQWFLKITLYAKELYLGLSKLNKWPKEVVKMQRNWIGPQRGILVTLLTKNFILKKIKIFIKNIELIPAITGILISFDHPILKILIKNNLNIKNFVNKCIINNNLYKDYTLSKKILAINTGILVINPLNNLLIPIWLINNIYLKNNTNIKIICPGYDLEDYKLSNLYNIKNINIIEYKNYIPKFLEYKKLTSFEKNYNCKLLTNNNERYNCLSLYKARKIILNILLKKKIAKKIIIYKIKDWCISRQRLWGVPIPIIKDKNNKIILKLNENNLPFKIKKINNSYYYLLPNCIPKKIDVKFIETLDTFFESSWYYLRYISPYNKKKIFSKKLANYWLPIDLYIGGIEHAILHLLYFRVFHKLIRDLNLINSDEPTYNLICQGMVVSDSFYYFNKKKIHWVNKKNIKIIRNNKNIIKKIVHIYNNKHIYYYGKTKMSKSKKNGINSNDIINKYGADALRLSIMFAAPIRLNLEWDEKCIKGVNKFLNRLWILIQNHISLKCNNFIRNKIIENYFFIKIYKKIYKKILFYILEIYNDLEYKLSFNTAISKIYIIFKKIIKIKYKSYIDWIFINNLLLKLLIIMYPFIPHIICILWYKIKKNININEIKWPYININIFNSNKKKILVQINSKFKEIIYILNNTSKSNLKKIILNNIKIMNFIKNKNIKKIIFIKNKIINIIV